jgi:hypothetical protein
VEKKLSKYAYNVQIKKIISICIFHVNACRFVDTPASFLMDSTSNPKVKTTKGERIGARSLVCNILEVKRCVGALGWGIGRLTNNSIIHTDMHKSNNKLVTLVEISQNVTNPFTTTCDL